MKKQQDSAVLFYGDDDLQVDEFSCDQWRIIKVEISSVTIFVLNSVCVWGGVCVGMSAWDRKNVKEFFGCWNIKLLALLLVIFQHTHTHI